MQLEEALSTSHHLACVRTQELGGRFALLSLLAVLALHYCTQTTTITPVSGASPCAQPVFAVIAYEKDSLLHTLLLKLRRKLHSRTGST